MKKLVLILFITAFSFTYNDSAKNPSSNLMLASVISCNGIVLYHEQDEFYWQDVKLETKFFDNDEIKTTTESYCELKLSNGNIIKLEPNTLLTLNSKKDGKKNLGTYLSIIIGKIWVKAEKKNEPFFIKTPFASICVKGTLYSIDAPSGLISVFEGTVEVSNEKQTYTVGKGSELNVTDAGELEKPKVICAQTIKEFEQFSNSSSLPQESLQKTLLSLKKQTNYKELSLNGVSNTEQKGLLRSIKDFIKNIGTN